MTKHSNRFLWTVFALAVVTSGCETMNGEPAPVVSECQAEAKTSDPNRVAHGAQSYTLEECLARIPCDATPSQKMLAEETCKRDAEGRQQIEKVPLNKRD